MLRRRLGPLLPLLLATLAGCARPEFADRIVVADSPEALAAFRAELARDHAAPQLAGFETALDELQLAGMDRHPTAAARAAAMRAIVHGRTVRAVEILGWQARRDRLRSEIASLTPTIKQDRRTRERDGAATSPTVLNRIQNVEAILEQLHRHLAETETQLQTLGTPAGATP